MRIPIISSINPKGQALVEMALIIPLLLLLVMGIFEIGRAMYIKNTLTQAARAGARSAVVIPGLVSPYLDKNCSDDSIIVKTTCGSLYSGINKNDATVSVKVFAPGVDPAEDPDNYKTTTVSSPPSPGDTVEVKVNILNFKTKYRIVPFIPLPLNLTGSTSMRYE
jgi:hypothetical protein